MRREQTFEVYRTFITNIAIVLLDRKAIRHTSTVRRMETNPANYYYKISMNFCKSKYDLSSLSGKGQSGIPFLHLPGTGFEGRSIKVLPAVLLHGFWKMYLRVYVHLQR